MSDKNERRAHMPSVERLDEFMDIEVELPVRVYAIDDDGNPDPSREYVAGWRSRVIIDGRDPSGALHVKQVASDWAGRDELVLRPLDSSAAALPGSQERS